MVFHGNAKRTVMGMTERLTALSIEKMEKLYRNRTDLYHIIEADTEQGKVPAVEKNNRFYSLNSFYNTQKAAEEWAKQFERDDINDNSIIIVYGMSDGKNILKLCEQRPACKIIVYEPCQDIFWKVMEYEEVAELAEKENVCLIELF